MHDSLQNVKSSLFKLHLERQEMQTGDIQDICYARLFSLSHSFRNRACTFPCYCILIWLLV